MRTDFSTLDARAFGLAAGTVAAAISAVCALALMIAPDATKALVGYLIHSDLAGLTPTVTWASLFTGIIGWGLIAGVAFSAAAGLYNRVTTATRTEGEQPVHGVRSRA